MTRNQTKKPPGIFSLLKPYRVMLITLLLFTLASNAVNLLLPLIIAHGIDAFSAGTFVMSSIIIKFSLATLFVFVIGYLQGIIQTFASEKVARDLRTKLSEKISWQSYAYIERANPSKLLTNLTSDIDSIKLFISQAIVSIISSVFIIIGASILLLTIDWKLALVVLTCIPIIGVAFYILLKKVRALFVKSREIIDWLNKVINESILGSALIRVINSQQLELDKFTGANTNARNLGLSIVKMFAGLIPIIIFVSSLASLSILTLGGHFVIRGSMSLGSFAAFNSYLSLLIFPIIVIGFMSNLIVQANASFSRISVVLDAPENRDAGTSTDTLTGNIKCKHISVTYGQKPVLKDISFSINAGSKVAIIGPTAAGKTQLLYLLTGLIKPDTGVIEYDGKGIDQFNKESFHQQVGFVFQDSIIFNMSIRENIAFSDIVTDESLEKAIQTAELKEFIQSLPGQLSTVVSERGSSLSGGQKQRIMLARALAVNPKILLLDDFTARVDNNTEKEILQNIQQNYPGLTLVSVTQKIESVAHYDKIILLMEGEIIASGTHQELLETSTEYVQIYDSQQSTNNYELQS